MAAWIFGLILAVIFVIVNGCTQVFYAQKKGYKIKPTAFAYFVGAIGNLVTGNVVPISAQAETITVSGEIKEPRDRITALLIAAVIGVVFGWINVKQLSSTFIISHISNADSNLIK